MQTPVRIDFQGTVGNVEIQTLIAGHAAELEDRFDRVTFFPLALKGPRERPTGGLHEDNAAASRGPDPKRS